MTLAIDCGTLDRPAARNHNYVYHMRLRQYAAVDRPLEEELSDYSMTGATERPSVSQVQGSSERGSGAQLQLTREAT